MRVLVACEESQRVCKAFRELGHETFSCDTQPCSGGYPEWHNANIPRIAVENPTPLKIYELPKHTQAIQPYMFGHPFSKKTLLWLKGLPELKATDVIKEYTPYLPSNTGGKKRGQKFKINNVIRDPKEASKTFKGIAKAIAEQWHKPEVNQCDLSQNNKKEVRHSSPK